MLFTFSVEFFLGGVLSLVSTLPLLTDILSVSFSLCELSPAFIPTRSGEDFIGSAVDLSVVSVLPCGNPPKSYDLKQQSFILLTDTRFAQLSQAFLF